MVVAVQQPSVECTAILIMCIDEHRPPSCAVTMRKTSGNTQINSGTDCKTAPATKINGQCARWILTGQQSCLWRRKISKFRCIHLKLQLWKSLWADILMIHGVKNRRDRSIKILIILHRNETPCFDQESSGQVVTLCLFTSKTNL